MSFSLHYLNVWQLASLITFPNPFFLQFLLIEILISVMIKYFVNDLFKRKNSVYFSTAQFLLLEFGTNVKNLGQNLKVFLKKASLKKRVRENP